VGSSVAAYGQFSMAANKLKAELARHLRDVLVNSYGAAQDEVERHVLRMSEQLTPSSVIVNETEREGWRADQLPHVIVLGAMADHGRLISVVIDRAIASSLSLGFVDYPTSLN
jgi:hypothetical protein